MIVAGMIDTDQNLYRRFDILAPEDGSEDFAPQYGGTSRVYRPYRVELTYRVNRGATMPFWYCFTAKVKGRQVLKGNRLSQSYSGQHDRRYTMGPTRPDGTPEWLWALAGEMLPVTAFEDPQYPRELLDRIQGV